MLRSGATSLFSDLDVEVVPDAPIGAMTWYGVGGGADFLIRPRSVDALQILTKRCFRSGIPLRVFGSGANLLIADEGVDGIVVMLDGPAFKETRYDRKRDVTLLRAMAGAGLAKMLIDGARRGLGGLTHMAGIPATVGGAIRMNAGGAFGCIGDAVESVTCITKAGQRTTYPAGELKFEYRRTNIPDPIILAATFRLTPGDPIAVRERVKEVFQHKKSTQPLGEHSAGCVFKNPVDPVSEQRVSAGKLIDQAGLKGLELGGAKVSTRHANFIVVEAGATAGDVVRLMDEVCRRVFDHCGIELENEIVVWQREQE